MMSFQNHCNHQTASGIMKSVYNSHSAIIPSKGNLLHEDFKTSSM